MVILLFAPQEGEKPAGHSLHGEAFNEGPRQRAYLIPGMGAIVFPVTTKSAEAQAFFSQGVGQLHGFYYFEAERSFRQAAALDPSLALAYWGMAKANVNNEKRAKVFIEKAVQLKGGASPREVLWINALSDYYKNPSGEKRSRPYIKALENIVGENPDDLEAKAFLAWALWHHKDKGLPIQSHQAVDSVIGDVLRGNAMHPGAHHYRIHLWDEEKPPRGLDSARLFGPSAPGIAHAWHMPGHIYTKLHRYDEAAQQQEASARVDHAQMIRDRTMPYQIHNFAHNNQWLMQNLAFIGCARTAIEIGENMVEIPRHPSLNKISDDNSCARQGRSRLFETLVKWELWDELLAREDTCLAPLDANEDQVKRLRALGAASFAKGDRDRGHRCISELEELLGKDPAKPAEEKDEKKKEEAQKTRDRKTKPVQNALAELRGLAEEDPKAALESFSKCDDLRKELLAKAQLRAGDKDKAEKTAKQAADGAKGQAVPLAHYTEVLLELGKQSEAAAAWKELAAITRRADRDLPILKRLQERLSSVAVDPAPAKKAVENLDSLGPLGWSPAPAPLWSLPSADGKPCSLASAAAEKPLVLIFYLGSKCAHCVEQLGKFSGLADEFTKAGMSMAAVSNESQEELARQQSKNPLKVPPFPLLADPSLEVFKEYRCFDDFEKIPLHGTFLIDSRPPVAARIRWQEISYTPFMDAKFLLEECRRLLSLR